MYSGGRGTGDGGEGDEVRWGGGGDNQHVSATEAGIHDLLFHFVWATGRNERPTAEQRYTGARKDETDGGTEGKCKKEGGEV